MRAFNWEQRLWPLYLSALLTGHALYIYRKLPANTINNFQFLKEAVLTQFNYTGDGYRARFREAKSRGNKNFLQLIIRLKSYLSRWIETYAFEKPYEELADLMVADHFLYSCSKDLVVQLRKTGLQDLNSIAS